MLTAVEARRTRDRRGRQPRSTRRMRVTGRRGVWGTASIPDRNTQIFPLLRRQHLAVWASEGIFLMLRSYVNVIPHTSVGCCRRFSCCRHLTNDGTRVQRRSNAVQARRLFERLETLLQRYHNRTLEMAEIIDQLIELAQEMNAANRRGRTWG